MRASSRRVCDPAHRDRILSDVEVLELDPRLAGVAATLGPPVLRTLDAIHLATALAMVPELDAFVTYDDRLAEAARASGCRWCVRPEGSPGSRRSVGGQPGGQPRVARRSAAVSRRGAAPRRRWRSRGSAGREVEVPRRPPWSVGGTRTGRGVQHHQGAGHVGGRRAVAQPGPERLGRVRADGREGCPPQADRVQHLSRPEAGHHVGHAAPAPGPEVQAFRHLSRQVLPLGVVRAGRILEVREAGAVLDVEQVLAVPPRRSARPANW